VSSSICSSPPPSPPALLPPWTVTRMGRMARKSRSVSWSDGFMVRQLRTMRTRSSRAVFVTAPFWSQPSRRDTPIGSVSEKLDVTKSNRSRFLCRTSVMVVFLAKSCKKIQCIFPHV